MAVIEDPITGDLVRVDPYKDAIRVTQVARGASYSTAAVTGTMAAALAANSPVFSMRLDPGAPGSYKAYIDRIRMQFTCIVAFTVPITAGRRLAVFRGSGAACAGQTGITIAPPKDSSDPTSEFNAANGGDIRISTTAAQTVVGVTFEADPQRVATLTHVGTAGAHFEILWEFNSSDANPIVLNAGQLIAIRNPAAMDAAGTWTLSVNVDWYEGII